MAEAILTLEAHMNKFSHMSDEELDAFIREGVAGLDASRGANKAR